MYTGELSEGSYSDLNVIIKDTTFSTHKVFNETYARLKIYNESRKNYYATFRGVVNIEYATFLNLESKYPITLRFIDNTFFNNYDMMYGVIRAPNVNFMNDRGSTYYNNVGNLGSVYCLSIVYINITAQEIYPEFNPKNLFTGIQAYNNYAQYGGVIYIIEATKLSFESCTFNNNQASKKGGTMYI